MFYYDSAEFDFDRGWNAAMDACAGQSERIKALEIAIRNHRDQKGDDRCWMDDQELYKVLPEGYTPPKRDTCVQLELCQKYIQSRQNPQTEYISPQRRIEELELEIKYLKGTNNGSVW